MVVLSKSRITTQTVCLRFIYFRERELGQDEARNLELPLGL